MYTYNKVLQLLELAVSLSVSSDDIVEFTILILKCQFMTLYVWKIILLHT